MKTKKSIFNLSRRTVVKGIGVLVTSSALAGCSKNNGEVYVTPPAYTGDYIKPEEQLQSIPSGAGRACGGLCIVKAQVEDGVVKRFVSDDIFDEEIGKNNPFGRLQTRACLKCRSWKYMMYNSNRVIYPLMQTKERGDLSGFIRVSWDKAMGVIKERTDHIRKTYGPGAVFLEQAGGNGGYGGFFLGLNQMTGGAISTRQDFSQACWEHVANFVRPQRFTDFGVTWAPNSPFDDGGERDAATGWIKGITGYNIVANAITDFFKAEHIVLWSANPAEVFGVHHSNMYLKRMKEEGIEFTVVDQRISPSVTSYADHFISPVQNTDSALIMAVIYSMLTTHYDKLKALYGVNTDLELKEAIGKYLYGFFDTGANPTSYNEDLTIKTQVYPQEFATIPTGDFAAKYAVSDGGSWSAYIFGTDGTLVSKGLNNATSIYPDKIGYCVRDYDYPGEVADPLKGKYVPCYGKVPKTPAWAEKITGVSAADIESLAERLLTKKTSFYIGFGFQRNHEGEQGTWSMLLLSTLIKSFGAPGQSIGIPRAPGYVQQNDRFNYGAWLPPLTLAMGGYMNSVYADIAPFMHAYNPAGYLDSNMAIDYKHLGFHDEKKLSFPALTDDYTRTCIPIKGFYDMISATNQEKVNTKVLKFNSGSNDWEEGTEEVYPSLWNDGQVQRLPKPIRAVFAVGSNKITSNGADVNRTVRAYHETTLDSKHPKKYKIELVAVIDPFMTGTARYADIILPSAATSEKFIAPISVQGNEVINILSAKASEPLGEALNDIDIGGKYYAQWEEEIPGITAAYYGTCKGDENMGSDEKVVKSLWENPFAPNDPDKPSYNEWKRTGVYYANRYASKYFRDSLIPANPASPSDFPRINHKDDVFIWNQEFRLYPDKYPLHTPSGRVEAYCQSMVEDFEARNFFNYDDNITIDSPIKFAGTPSGWETKGRYLYPVPMYIPTVEGRHACDTDATAPSVDANNPNELVTGHTKHPNPMGFENGFDYVLCNYHPIQRVHTLHNSNPVINELFKYGADGQPAFYGSDNSNGDPAVSAPKVMTSDVYEPALIGVGSKYADGSEIKNGELVIVESDRGKAMYSAKLTKRIKPFHISVGQGSAYNPAGNKGLVNDIDKGGATGTLISQRPSRFGRGFTASDIRVRITRGA